MAHDRPAFPPWLGVAVAVASVSFAAPLFRLADAPAVTASFWRLALACLLLAPFAGRAFPAWRARSPRDWLLSAGAGVALAFHFAVWVTSLQYTTVAAATALVTLQAVFVALGGHLLLGDRLRPAGWLGVAVAVAGGLLIGFTDRSAGGEGANPLLGDLLAVVAGLGSAAYMLVGRRVRSTQGLVEYVLPVYATAALALALSAPFAGAPLLAGLGSQNFLWFGLLAAVPMLGGHTVSNWVLRYLPAHTVATWILLEPAGAALLAYLWLGEVPADGVILGGALVLLGALLTIPRTRAPATEPAG